MASRRGHEMNSNLPIYPFRELILKTIDRNQVTIIVAETGSGKSTQVPQMLLSGTDNNIVVTQPRRIAAKSIAKRVAEETNSVLGEMVGFRTSFEKQDSENTRCLFCTDGLQLVREITKARLSTSNKAILIIDEVHEWNLNIEMLVAWCKKKISTSNIKIVLMSATITHERLRAYFNFAAVVNIPGKSYPVIGSPTHERGLIQKPSGELLTEIKDQVFFKRNTLVFLPGKQEIANVHKELLLMDLPATILDLHSELEVEEQDKVFLSYDTPKVVLSTNIAQTSVTIPDISTVIDSGMERRIELIDDIETLILGVISKNDVIQRAGRAGRTKEGYYILCNDLEFKYFNEYPIPEIKCSKLNQLVLRFINADIDPMKTEFFNQPEKKTLSKAKKALIALGALDKEGISTRLGQQISLFASDVTTARIIVEAVHRECLEPVLIIAAILENNFQTIRMSRLELKSCDSRNFEELLSKKVYRSDLLFELELYKSARKFNIDDLENHSISKQAYLEAVEKRSNFEKTVLGLLSHHDIGDFNRNSNNEEEILKCILAGMIFHLHKKVGYGIYKSSKPYSCKLDNASIMDKNNLPEYLVGNPRNLVSYSGEKAHSIHILTNCTETKLEWLEEFGINLPKNRLNGLVDAKSTILLKAEKYLKTIPSFLVINKSGSFRDPTIKVGILFDGICIAEGIGKTINEAEQKASLKVLTDFNWPE